MSIVVHHVTGARIVVDELVIENLWAPLNEGIPEPAWWNLRIREHVSQAFTGAHAFVRLAPVAWPDPSTTSMRRRTETAPRYLCAAAVRVDAGGPEGEVRAVLAWCENGSLEKRAEELLQTCATLSLDREPDAREVTGAPSDGSFTARDNARCWLHERARFRFRADDGGADRALAAWAPHCMRLPSDFTSTEPPVLVRLDLHGHQLAAGAVHAAPNGGSLSALDLAFVAPARGDVTLHAALAAAVARVDWNRVARPAYSAYD